MELSLLLLLWPIWYIISLSFRLICQYDSCRLGFEQLSFLIATPIPCDHGKWKVRALVFGIFPIPLQSTKWPWHYYDEVSAREGIKTIRNDPSRWFIAERL